MVTLAGAFLKRGFAVDLVVAHAVGPNLDRVPLGVRLVDLGTIRMSRSIPSLLRYLRRERPVALLSTCNQANVVAAIAGRLAGGGTRIVLRQGDTLSVTRQHLSGGFARMLPRLARWFYPWADHIIANSDGVASDLIECVGLPRNKVTRIYNHVEIDEVLARAEATVDDEWFAPGALPVILGVGRLTEVKDWPTLIRAFALVRDNRAVRLVILGEGKERPAIQALVDELGLQGDVHMPGFASNPYAVMAKAAMVVLSSRLEGLPNVLIEAMALGRPVVSTDCPSGPRELLDNGRLGPLVTCGDVPGLANAIQSVLDAPLAPKMLKAWASHFHEDAIIPQYLEVLVGNPPGCGACE